MIIRKKGFTLVELIIVIVILGILAVVAVPRYFALRTQAATAAERGVVGAVRSGIALYRANDLATGGTGSYPAALDAVAGTYPILASDTNPLFTNVLDEPVTDGWSKTAATDYDGPTGNHYRYTAGTGRFEQFTP